MKITAKNSPESLKSSETGNDAFNSTMKTDGREGKRSTRETGLKLVWSKFETGL
jgi:hypothetical protein